MNLVDVIRALEGDLGSLIKQFELVLESHTTSGVDQVAAARAIIDAYAKTVVNPIAGAYIHMPTPDQKQQVAELLVSAAKKTGLALPYLMGAMCQESLFCCDVRNENLKGAAHGKASFVTTDWGPCQVSGKNLPTMPGMTGLTQDQMAKKACDPVWAIPLFANTYLDLVRWAQSIRKGTDAVPSEQELIKEIAAGGSAVDPHWRNPGWLATLAYNRGRMGALQEVASGIVVAHPAHVSTLVNHFCDLMKVPHLMPEDAGLNDQQWN